MEQRLFGFPSQSFSLRFREAPFELLADFLKLLNEANKDKLNEHILLMTNQLKLDPLVGYHAIELLHRFMVRHLTDLLSAPVPQGAAAHLARSYEDAVLDRLKDETYLIVFSCVQIASKLSLHAHTVDNATAVRFLHSAGHSVSKQAVLESELMVLKGLGFRLDAPNPLAYVEVLLEVLAHNEPSVQVERLHHLSHHVLRLVVLERDAIFHSLLVASTQCARPSRRHRERFVTVTEDYMLLGVGVIAVASYIEYVRTWEQVVAELSHITGISERSISDFAQVTLIHIVGGDVPAASARGFTRSLSVHGAQHLPRSG